MEVETSCSGGINGASGRYEITGSGGWVKVWLSGGRNIREAWRNEMAW